MASGSFVSMPLSIFEADTLSVLFGEVDLGWKKPRKLRWPFAAGADAVEAVEASSFCFFVDTGFEETEIFRFLSWPFVLPSRGAAESGDCEGSDGTSELLSEVGLLSSVGCWDSVVAGFAFGAANMDFMLLRLSNSCKRLPEKAGISCIFHSR